jgi:hypothetical protein
MMAILKALITEILEEAYPRMDLNIILTSMTLLSIQALLSIVLMGYE